jgi:hypothetical protein
MHAVVVTVTINDAAAAQSELRDKLVPWASNSPGFVSGYWTIKGDSGLTMLIFDSEDAANRMSEQARSAVPDAMTLENVEVREVAAHASRAATSDPQVEAATDAPS